MLRNIALILAITLWGFGPLLAPQEAIAQTALTRAVLESLRNQVRLIPRNQQARPARVSDAMTPGDAVATARASAAQLRFNDGSLARLGEQAVFRFTPGTRNFHLSNGTALLLIPPGQGRTGVRTPNAAAGIRGSALFVRYNPETNTTLVGALTNSGIEVFNQTGSQRRELKAGYMAVIAQDRIERVYEFDLETFYRTSELARGLDLNRTQSTANPDEAIAAVQAETVEALGSQSSFTGEQVIVNPSFVQLPANTSQDFPDVNFSVIDAALGSANQNSGFANRDSAVFRNGLDVRGVIEGGAVRADRDNPQFPGFPGNGNGNGGGFPGQGNGNGGGFPGQGNGNGGGFPGQGNGNGGGFPGQGNGNGGDFPGQGNGNGGDFPGQGNGNGGDFPGQGNGNGGDFPGQGNGNGGDFPGQGNGVDDGFPGQGNGVDDGFPGQGNGVDDGFPGQGNGVDDGFPGQGNGNGGTFPGGGNGGNGNGNGGNGNGGNGNILQIQVTP